MNGFHLLTPLEENFRHTWEEIFFLGVPVLSVDDPFLAGLAIRLSDLPRLSREPSCAPSTNLPSTMLRTSAPLPL